MKLFEVENDGRHWFLRAEDMIDALTRIRERIDQTELVYIWPYGEVEVTEGETIFFCEKRVAA